MHASTASEHYIFGGGADDLQYSNVDHRQRGWGCTLLSPVTKGVGLIAYNPQGNKTGHIPLSN